MSKAFKIIVDIVIVLCILSVVALIVPSLVGVKTDIVGPKTDSNLDEGSVIYGVRRPVGALMTDDEIVYSSDDCVYVYSVVKVDSDNGEVYAFDPKNGETSVLQMNKNATKKVLTVPYLGYLMIATRSMNGMATLICAALVLVALFIVAELWYRKTRREKGLRYRGEDDDYFTALAQSMEKPGALDEISKASAPVETPPEPLDLEAAGKTINIPEPAASSTKASEAVSELILEPVGETAPAAAVSPETTGIIGVVPGSEDRLALGETSEFVAAFEEYENVPHNAPERPAQPQIRQAAEAYSASQLLNPQSEKYSTENIVAAFAEVPDDNSAASLDMSDDQLPDVSDALVAALDTTQVSRAERPYHQPVKPAEPEVEVDPEMDEIELAIPVKTLDEILEDAYAKGFDPLVTTDDVTGVKLVDFSDCL